MKRVLVTGGASGMGAATARIFAREGAKVTIADMLEAEGRAVAAEIGAAARFVPLDVTDEAQWEKLVAEVVAQDGRLDVLVNNASGFGSQDTEEGWAPGLSVDVMATVRASRAALPHLERSRGCIVNVSSISGFMPSTRTPAYAAVKALLVNYTASQAQMHAPKGVRVNGVAPGGPPVSVSVSLPPGGKTTAAMVNVNGRGYGY